MLDSTRWRVVALAERGFSARLITQQILKYDGAEYSTGALYKVIRDAGVRIKDYRNGENPIAHETLHNLFKNQTAMKAVIRRMGGKPMIEKKARN